jgi:hypothetical protein
MGPPVLISGIWYYYSTPLQTKLEYGVICLALTALLCIMTFGGA